MADCGMEGKRDLIKSHREKLIWLWHGERNGGAEEGKLAHALVQLGQNRILNPDSSISLLISLATSWSLLTLFT